MHKHSMEVCWLHLIWSTKERYPYFEDQHKVLKVLEILKDICSRHDVFYKTGYVNPDYVHLLVDLPVNLSIQKLLQYLKGLSSHMINEIGLFKTRFSWSKRYAASSVSSGEINSIVQYINNQREHHRKVPFLEEWNNFKKKIDMVISP